MKKLVMLMMLGTMLLACSYASKDRVLVSRKVLVQDGAVCGLSQQESLSTRHPVRLGREPVLLLRILSEL